MRVLLIDNYDSYTYNLFQLLAEVYGVDPVVRRNDELADLDLGQVDAIVISPGPGHPLTSADVGRTESVVRRSGLPVLGVCLGHQLLASMAGASVRPVRPVHGQVGRVSHVGADLFAGLPPEFAAVRYHSLAVATPLPESLVALAWAEDGVVMGVRHRELPWWGVQFHPESIGSEQGARLLRNFARLAGHSPAPGRAQPLPRPRKAGRRVVSRRLERAVDTAVAFRELFGDNEFAFWLDSAGTSRFSFLGAPDEILRYRTGTGRIDVCRNGNWSTEPAPDIFTVLRERLDRLDIRPPEDAPFDFPTGYVGYFGYELKSECGAPATQTSATPDAFWLRADRMIVVDHDLGQTWVLAIEDSDWVAGTAARIAGLADSAPRETAPWHGDIEPFLDRSHDRYLADIAECHRQLHLGNSYEICLTNALEFPFSGDPLDFYLRLRTLNPTPYSAYLRLGELAVVSSSPERFLAVDTDGTAESRPIKGTAPRDPDPVLDEVIRERLRTDPKTVAENLMIVDLLRNDLGTVCDIGSVTVPRFLAVETYATLHQLVTTVRGRLRPDIGAVDAVRACFPGGSMTGAPKLRTMTIIDELERRPRGIYSGALGYFSSTGAADLSIVIRTAIIAGGRLTVGAGGAIVVGSDPEDEYQEMLLKARAPLRALKPRRRSPIPPWPASLAPPH